DKNVKAIFIAKIINVTTAVINAPVSNTSLICSIILSNSFLDILIIEKKRIKDTTNRVYI
ncbi:MAG: hypothetical protein WAZ73_13720, partial [Blautia wexlerae]